MQWIYLILIGLVGGVAVGLQTPISGMMGCAYRRDGQQFYHPSQRDAAFGFDSAPAGWGKDP